MLLLYVIGFLAGLVAGISPCILPVLPVVLVAGASVAAPIETTDPDGEAAHTADTADAPVPPNPPGVRAAPATRGAPAQRVDSVRRGRRRRRRSFRPYAVVGGLVVSFSVFTLVGSSLLSALGLPQDFLRDAGLVVLGVAAAGLLFPALGHVLERPFARFGRRQPTTDAGAFVLGLGLGVLFVPCAGPVLAAITVVSATHQVGLRAVVLTVDFALGAAVPLLAVALAGQRMAERVRALRSRAALARRVGGAVLLAMTLLIAFNVTNGLQRVVPGYTSALQKHIEGGGYAKRQLASLTGSSASTSLADCTPSLPVLEDCGAAPPFQGISAWLNTPGGRPLSLQGLRGKVVLVDFWTYSCINCQRTLPHVESWYARYRADGLVVVGVHTPEFAFEHVVSNVVQASHQLGVRYPVAVDNGYKTWTAYSNQYWPAEYLIDAAGHVRHAEFGEGNYPATESLIRDLLVSARPDLRLPGTTHVPDATPTGALTPESYLGYTRLQNFAGTSITPDRAASYQFPGVLPPNTLALAGTWTVGKEKASSGPAARLELAFHASRVYLVLGGTGTVDVAVNGTHTQTVDVSGIPRLYTLVQVPQAETATLVLTVPAGVDAYDFTFG